MMNSPESLLAVVQRGQVDPYFTPKDFAEGSDQEPLSEAA